MAACDSDGGGVVAERYSPSVHGPLDYKALIVWGRIAGYVFLARLSFGIRTLVGIQPVPVEERIDTQFSKIFFLWFSWNVNILT